jgi:hypothetical protein
MLSKPWSQYNDAYVLISLINNDGRKRFISSANKSIGMLNHNGNRATQKKREY